jgi:hypothetical protein
MPQRATASVIALLNKLPRRALTEIGMVAAAWAYLETEFDLALECLLSNRKPRAYTTIISSFRLKPGSR